MDRGDEDGRAVRDSTLDSQSAPILSAAIRAVSKLSGAPSKTVLSIS